MNRPFSLNYIIAAVLIGIYLIMPTTIFAQSVTFEDGLPAAEAVYCAATSASCADCPCSDEKGSSSCCDSTFCCCACHAPLSRALQLVYAPVVALQNFREPTWSFPQVYRTIFVPPQNRA